MPEDFSKDPRVYFAAERTLLAWIRTGIALMGFGFVVARFGLFLRELQASEHEMTAQSPRFSLWIGTALVLIGVIVNLVALIRYRQLIEQLKGGRWMEGPSRLGIIVAISLAGVGSAMAVYLLVVR